MRKALIIGVLLVGGGIYSYFQFRPNIPSPGPQPPEAPPEKLISLDPASPTDTLLENYLAAVHSAGQLQPGKEAIGALLARFDTRAKYLAEAALEPIAASRALARAFLDHEQAIRKKFPEAFKEEKIEKGKEFAALLIFELTPAIYLPFPDAPGTLLLLDGTKGKPDVLKKIERDEEVLYRLRWRLREGWQVQESLILVQEEGTWKVLFTGADYNWRSVADDPSTGKGGNSGLFRADQDWKAADFRKANRELAALLEHRQKTLDELTRQILDGTLPTFEAYWAALGKRAEAL